MTDNSLSSILEKSKSVMVLLPTKPFFDQVAAGLSLYLALRERKDVVISTVSPMTVEFNRLVGVNKISTDLGNKNLIIRFNNYEAKDIERVSYDIEDGQFRLTVIPKPGVPAPKKENADLSYSGVSADTVILIGGANESHFPSVATNELAGVTLVHVGTRPLNLSGGKKVISLARPASSISELVAKLISENNMTIDSDIATNLLMGVDEGSNKLSGPDTSADTFQLVADLMRAGGRRVSPRPQQRAYPRGAVPGQDPRAPRPQQSPQPVSTQPKTQPVSTQPSSQSAVSTQDKQDDKAPKDWLEPKIYKGTSVN